VDNPILVDKGISNFISIDRGKLIKEIRNQLNITQRVGRKKRISEIERIKTRTSKSNLDQVAKLFGEYGAYGLGSQFKKLISLLREDFILTQIDSIENQGKKKLVLVKTKNRLIIDTGLILDGEISKTKHLP
jgi:transcriptional regulator with XRE-family HTH domain